MKQTVNMGGKDVVLEVNAATPFKYKREFGEDLFQELGESYSVADEDTIGDLSIFFKLTYVMAKTHDKDLPEMEEWYESFDSLDYADVFGKAGELLQKSMITGKN